MFYITIAMTFYTLITEGMEFAPESLYRAAFTIVLAYLLMDDSKRIGSAWAYVYIANIIHASLNLYYVKKFYEYIIPDIVVIIGSLIMIFICSGFFKGNEKKLIIHTTNMIIASRVFSICRYIYETYSDDFIYASNIPVIKTIINIIIYTMPGLIIRLNPELICNNTTASEMGRLKE